MQDESDQTERDTGDASTVSSMLAGAVDAGRKPRGTSEIARKNDDGEHRAPYVVRRVAGVAWLFAGTKLKVGSRFGNAGIEIDKSAPSSPPGTKVVAELPNLMGPGLTGQMTYYERGGAKVFAAGAFTLAGACFWPTNRQIMENLWARLSVR